MKDVETSMVAELSITSPAFDHNGTIPVKYTCDGEKLNPAIHIGNIPTHTLSLVMIAEDPDTSKGTFDHWVAWNIEPTSSIEEGDNPGISGINSAGETGYRPPCPPEGKHRYFFYVFALDTLLDLEQGSGKEAVVKSMQNHILAKGMLMGYYSREK